MKQADIFEAYLDPIAGSEQGGNRPVVIVSGNFINKLVDHVIACPLTSKIKNYAGNPILEPNDTNGLSQASEIMVIHISSISKDRLKRKLGKISSEELELMKTTLNKLLRF